MASREPVKLTDPRSIRALAHPARLAVIEELYSGRELTATECAEIAGLSPSAMSYHLRSLEKYGIVERAAGRDGRERPWRAAGSYLQIEGDNPAVDSALTGVLLSRLGEQWLAWEAAKGREPKPWREASTMTSGQAYLQLDELAELTATVQRLLEKYDRDRSRDSAPPDARRVRVSFFAFPTDALAEGEAPAQ